MNWGEGLFRRRDFAAPHVPDLATRPAAARKSPPVTDRLADLAQVIFLGVFAAAIFLQSHIDNDLWWHLRTGMLILQTKQIPMADPYSWSAMGTRWITHEWLAELLFAVVYQVGTFRLLVGLTAGFVALSVGFLAWLLRQRTSPMLALELSILSTLALAFAFTVRPQLFSFASIIFLMWLFHPGPLGKRWWLLPVLAVIWVNTHAGFAAGIIVVAIEVVARLTSPVERAEWRRGSVALLATAAALLANPNGLTGVLYPLGYAGTNNASLRYIAEWQSPNFHDPMFVPLILLLALFVLVPAPPSRSRVRALVFVALGLLSARHIPYAAITVAIALADAFSVTDLRMLTWLGQRAKAAPKEIYLLGSVVLLFSALTSPTSIFQATPPETDYPREGVAVLARYRPQRLLNEYDWGGYVIWRLWPTVSVGIDGRADVYGNQRVTDFVNLVSLKPGWQTILAQDNPDALLLKRDGPLAQVLAKDTSWQEIYKGKLSVVFVRADASP